MRKMRTKAGLIAYHTTAAEITLIGGFGICDECGKHSHDGYLVYESRIPLTEGGADG